ncbi:hypothetical protein CEXT_270631 [Caerostris extrusa]|uniref:Uncharacterized protein n=1 Tax=Caerostris extrusa TaxID=172846 RepID=A0AAV4SCY5_CAEEX|nr:hypothetical protein CEXT_270631 [Caerostris extrusa]
MASDINLYLFATNVLAPWIIGVISFIFVIIGAFMCYAIGAAVRLRHKLEKLAMYMQEYENDQIKLVYLIGFTIHSFENDKRYTTLNGFVCFFAVCSEQYIGDRK